MKIGIVDYGACNLSSIYNSIYRLGYNPLVIKNPNDFKSLDRLIIPGVGAAKQCIDNLKEKKYFEEIFKFYKTGKPLLGICLGMQIFGKNLFEHGKSDGFGIVDADIIKIDKKNPFNIGWRIINLKENSNIKKIIPNKSCFYFCHSYFMSFNTSLEKKYCEGFVEEKKVIPSIVVKNNYIGTQFHPEKSQGLGEKFILNFISKEDLIN